jgi:hypothetical protein
MVLLELSRASRACRAAKLTAAPHAVSSTATRAPQNPTTATKQAATMSEGDQGKYKSPSDPVKEQVGALGPLSSGRGPRLRFMGPAVESHDLGATRRGRAADG